ncbi:MAG TPA: methyltransferase domain-containing protein, partial [Beijerinckiaceae bacterium]|nr:methyltransferase domain-containing protein [Beijerinckiaceae bacterium]
DLLKSIPVRSNRFGFEPEITMKASKRKLRIYEVPISYHGRTDEEGKKIGWKDGLKVFGVILHFWLVDDLYEESYGRGSLNNLSGTPQYVSWTARILRRYLGDTVLELGAGIGNMTGRLMGKRLLYIAGETDPLYLHALRNRFLRTPNVCVSRIDPGRAEDFAGIGTQIDTVLCLNVLEYVEDPAATLGWAAQLLRPGGTLLVLVPQSPSLYCSIDRTLGYRRRFSREDIGRLLTGAGLDIERTHQLNRVGAPAWWLYGKLLGRARINRVTLKAFDKTVWLWRRIEFLLPWRGLTLIAVAKKPA